MLKTKGFAEGFREGAEAMREKLLEELRRVHPAGMLRALEVAEYVAKTPLPEIKQPVQSP